MRGTFRPSPRAMFTPNEVSYGGEGAGRRNIHQQAHTRITARTSHTLPAKRHERRFTQQATKPQGDNCQTHKNQRNKGVKNKTNFLNKKDKELY